MAGSKHGVAAQLHAEEPRALLTHCYGHALNLAVVDAMKQSKVCHDALDTSYEISKPIRFSPKRNAALDRIKIENLAEEESGPSHGIRSFCPTRWTVRGDAIRSMMTQSRLNHVMLLSINRERVNKLDIDAIADEFVRGSKHRHCLFRKFTTNA